MGIRPIFDVNNNIVLPTIVLCNRNKHKLGTIFPIDDFEITPDIHNTNECSFKVYREINGVENPLWDKIRDLKLIYMPEYDEYFQIVIDKDNSDKTVKSIVANNLGVAELSQTMLYDIEINTDIDIERDDYEIALVYDPENPSQSLLGRVLSKAQHYKIKHVDSSIAKMVRSFSVDNESIYDFLTGDLADELNCLVIVGSDRTVSLYDLEDVCLDCGHREDDINAICPICGSSNIKNGYGEDTTIYVSTDNLSDHISLDSNADEVKNTFRVRGGDDLINAAVRAINPNGTEYINRFSDFVREDMPSELVDKLDSYQELYETKTPEYKQAMTNIYNAVDQILYFTSEMMPSPQTNDTDSKKELGKLTRANIGNIAVQNLRVAGDVTVNNAIKGVIQIFMSPGYNASIYSSTYSNGTWKGKFKVESVDDDTDVAINTSNITLTITDDYETFILQKLEKALAKNDVDISQTYNWTLYGLNRLSSFSDAYQSCLDILIEMGVGEPTHEFYKSIYLVYYNKKLAVDAEIKVREAQIKEQEAIQESNEKIRDDIQDELNFKKYLGEELYLVYCSYRMEDTYQNDNYVSDGLSNSELLQKAEELLEVAEKELYKASELQYSISTTIGNLFAMKEFEPIKSQFQVGNWIRIAIDDEVFKLRLIDYTIKNSDISMLQCNFSSVTKIQSGITDIKSVLSNAMSMSSSYESIKRQSKRSNKTSNTVNSWIDNGMNATAVAISDSDNQTVVYDGHGILCREYDDITETYSPEQLKIINNILAISDNNWETVRAAIGRIHYEDPENKGNMLSAYGVLAECLVGKLILGEALGIYNDGGSLKFNENGLEITNGKNTFKVNPNNKNKLFSITKGNTDILYVDANGNGVFNGTVYATNGEFTGTVHATDGSFKGNVTADTLTANTSGTIANWNISQNGFDSMIYETFPTMTDADIERLRNIILGNIQPISDDYKKYDIDQDGRFTMEDLVLANEIKLNPSLANASGKISINPNSLNETIMIIGQSGIFSSLMHPESFLTTIGVGSVKTNNLIVKNAKTSKIDIGENITISPQNTIISSQNITFQNSLNVNGGISVNEDIRINDQWYEGWTITQCLKNLYDKINAIDIIIDANGLKNT